MFPDETRVRWIRDLDHIEADLYSLYLRLERVRLELQREWHVLPNGEHWTPEKQKQAEERR